MLSVSLGSVGVMSDMALPAIPAIGGALSSGFAAIRSATIGTRFRSALTGLTAGTFVPSFLGGSEPDDPMEGIDTGLIALVVAAIVGVWVILQP